MIVLTIVVNGDPRAQPRPRAFSFRGHARVYNPKTTEGWKQQIVAAARDAMREQRPELLTQPLSGPLCVILGFRMPRPKSHFLRGELRDDAPGWHIVKPDADNLEKAVLDALTTAGVWCDDSRVCHKTTLKSYALVPGVTIEIEEL